MGERHHHIAFLKRPDTLRLPEPGERGNVGTQHCICAILDIFQPLPDLLIRAECLSYQA